MWKKLLDIIKEVLEGYVKNLITILIATISASIPAVLSWLFAGPDSAIIVGIFINTALIVGSLVYSYKRKNKKADEDLASGESTGDLAQQIRDKVQELSKQREKLDTEIDDKALKMFFGLTKNTYDELNEMDEKRFKSLVENYNAIVKNAKGSKTKKEKIENVKKINENCEEVEKQKRQIEDLYNKLKSALDKIDIVTYNLRNEYKIFEGHFGLINIGTNPNFRLLRIEIDKNGKFNAYIFKEFNEEREFDIRFLIKENKKSILLDDSSKRGDLGVYFLKLDQHFSGCETSDANQIYLCLHTHDTTDEEKIVDCYKVISLRDNFKFLDTHTSLSQYKSFKRTEFTRLGEAVKTIIESNSNMQHSVKITGPIHQLGRTD